MSNAASDYLSNGLYFREWTQISGDARGVVLIAHGLAEHCGRYAHVADALTTAGFAVFAVDHFGHGQSPGERGEINTFDDYLDGMDVLFDHARTQYPDRQVVMLGHSMGGLIAGRSVQRHPQRYQALVLSGPAVLPVDPPPKWQEGLVRLLSKWLPSAGVIALDGEAISRDPDVVKRYFDDPLVWNSKIPARLAAEIFDGMQALRDHANEIQIPTLIMHGTADRLTAPEGSVWLHEHIGAIDKTLMHGQDAFHELFNEPDQETYITAMIDWLLARQ
ncbi:MAG: lysophospholipase [Pseudomonadota bacterium]